MRFIKTLLLLCMLNSLNGCNSETERTKTGSEKRLVAHEELRIGTEFGDENYMFGNIKGVAIGTEGRIFVADQQGPIVRMYDKEGKFIQNVGREGRGPGEYTGISGIKTFPDGRLAIWNVGLTNINVFSPEGEYMETHFVNSTLNAPDLFEVGKEGEFFVKTTINRKRDEPNLHFAWLKISPDGEIKDTLEVPRDDVDRPLTFVLFTAQGDAHAFITWPRSTMSSEGYIVYAEDNNNYEIEFLKDERSVRTIRRVFKPVNLLPEEIKQWEAWTDYYSGRGADNVLPDYKPAIKQVFTDRDGRIWIWRYVEARYSEKEMGIGYGPESKWWEPPTFDVFRPDGSYYATIELPMNANFKDAKGEIVVAVVTGESGEEYVVRYGLKESE